MALSRNGIQSTQELLDAQSHVWNHLLNFINSMSLKCVIQLGIPDIILKHGKPMTLTELARSLHLNEAKSRSLERLMRIMIHSKFFINVKISQADEIEGYWLTPASHLLLRDEPLSVRPFALFALDPILTDPWHHVSEWFRTDGDPTPFVTTHGRTFWEYAGQDPRLNGLFNEGMASDSKLVATVITKDCRNVFEGLKSMVDVGGGTGTVAKAIADAFPGLKCVVLDLPHVVAGCEGTENLVFVAGDMFEYIPPADAVFMKVI
ncbi:UNVERIFIED_CONTAM: 8-hydroxyquercetin 8-O-methyltransferase [Sesamum radiatum]|uniref:8-hydroxyquercetin 8-O-methyltransferase n=1 Tax=Sesamum radiatum TaxID=300843 RepID=A0AAW2T4R2_SESRA